MIAPSTTSYVVSITIDLKFNLINTRLTNNTCDQYKIMKVKK